MRRERQNASDVLASLSTIEASWRDEFADVVIARITALPVKDAYDAQDIEAFLSEHFDEGLTVLRLALDMSADEFSHALKSVLPAGRGVKAFRAGATTFSEALLRLGVADQLAALVHTPITWREILVERLKSGRGSAIKGQARGRGLEDFVESIVQRAFGPTNYDRRCRFVGAKGASTEKADFAIPSKEDPAILIEVKAYGATGSKQTDVLGDVRRIVEEKRHDTDFLLVTDGLTWRQRESDLTKLVAIQNTGQITRIYTRAMAERLEADLKELRNEHGLSP